MKARASAGPAVVVADGADDEFVAENADDNAGDAGEDVGDETDGGGEARTDIIFSEVDAGEHAERDADHAGEGDEDCGADEGVVHSAGVLFMPTGMGRGGRSPN